jgi:uncharacterized delta-60 repeat protein
MNTSKILQSILLAAFTAAVFVCSAPQAHAQAGQLDPTFGTGGIYATTTGKSTGTAIAIQSDGKIVVAGGGLGSQTLADTLIRLNTNGTVDPSFGSAGVDNLEPPGATALGFAAAAIQSDGKIVALAETYNGLMVARVEPNGSLDSSFGTGGFTATVSLAGFNNLFPGGLAIQSDGKIVVVAGGGNPSIMARFDTNGTLDSTFGTGGVANLVSPSPTQVAVQSNGKILVTSGVDGQMVLAPQPASQPGTIIRYNSNGTVDTTFGSAGIAASLPSASALLVQSDGKILVAGGATSKVNAPPAASDVGFGLVRYNPNGSLDRTFGTGGVAITDFGLSAPDSASFALALQSNGDIVAAGAAGVNASGTLISSSFGLSRYTSAGILDTTFGTGGEVITTIDSGQIAWITGLAIQSDGKIVAVATLRFNIDFSNAYVARYLSQ